MLRSVVYAIAVAVVPAVAAPYALQGTEVRQLPTSANGQTYLLYVAYPASYASDPARRYPVIYFPDGYWDFTLMCTASGNLRVDGAIPDVFVVGIGYAGEAPDYGALRAIDLTPGIDPWYDPTGARTGRAAEFLSVLQTEIIPFIEREYRIDPHYRVLAGNSFGGLFTVYAALARPDLFQGYIASSPALWWGTRAMAAREVAYASGSTSLPIRLYFAYGTEDGASITETTKALYQQMKTRNYTGFSLALRQMEGERHSSVKAEAYTRGLRFALAPLAESPALAGTTMRASLINISTRGWVGTGDRVLIAGFVVSGVEGKRVLVRAAGPALAQFGVTDVLTDPQVRVQTLAGALMGANDNWPSTADMTISFLQAGAFPFSGGSRDAAFILTLPPGEYTAVVSGVNDTTGNAAVEVYEMP